MSTGFEDFQKVGKDSVETALKSVDAFSKGFQQIAADMSGVTREEYAAMMLGGGRSIEGNRSKKNQTRG